MGTDTAPIMENLKLCRFHPKRDIFWISVTVSEIWRYVQGSVTGCWGFCAWAKMAHCHLSYRLYIFGDCIFNDNCGRIWWKKQPFTLCRVLNKPNHPNGHETIAVTFLVLNNNRHMSRIRKQLSFNFPSTFVPGELIHVITRVVGILLHRWQGITHFK